MFENFVTNIRSSSLKLNESLSLENWKQKSSRLSESLENLKSSVINKTHDISSYLSSSVESSVRTRKQSQRKTAYNRNKKKRQGEKHKVSEFIGYENVRSSCNKNITHCLDLEYDDDDEEIMVDSDIIDKFVKVISLSDYAESSGKRIRRNDREEIRRRLAMGSDADDYYGNDRPGKKPSLQARLQSGMNLQICFMNETASDSESPNAGDSTPLGGGDLNRGGGVPSQKSNVITHNSDHYRGLKKVQSDGGSKESPKGFFSNGEGGVGFMERQARLQAEARMALSRAKDTARMQMQSERQSQQMSPITHMLRATLHKVGIRFPEGRRRVSRQMLTDMNVAQLQVIVNDLHTQIEQLNEGLVRYLMERDELHMSQDSMLVDIEDLTRYLGAKEESIKFDLSQNNNSTSSFEDPSGGGKKQNESLMIGRAAVSLKKK